MTTGSTGPTTGQTPRKKPVANARPSRPRKTPWVRRIVSTLILVAIVIGVGVLLVKVGSWVHAALTDTHAKTTESSTVKPVEILPCTDENLDVTLLPSQTVVDEGMGMDLVVSLENTGSTDCSVDTGDIQVQLRGDYGTVWTPTACDGQWARELLLGAKESWGGQLHWDGGISADCQPISNDGIRATAPSGSYTLIASVPGGQSAGATTIQVR